jgi:hypothetical protein
LHRRIDARTLGTRSIDDAAYDAIEAPLLSFQRDSAIREHLSGSAAEDFRREARLWLCTSDSLAVLPGLFPLGPFAYPFGETAWCEDLILYRDGELMLGIISHEDAGLMRLTQLEVSQLSAAGYPTDTSWPRG